MKSIKFKELVIDDKYKDLKNINVQIVEVKIVKSRMELLLNLESKEIINDDLYKSLYNFFREKFEDFNIKLHLRYDLNIQDDNNFRKYKEIINSIILDQIPSSRSWI